MSLFDGLVEDRCNYGQPDPGAGTRPCYEAATHRAHWYIPPTYPDGTPNPRAGAGSIACCLTHANYYAEAWCPLYPSQSDAAWIEPLDPPWAA